MKSINFFLIVFILLMDDYLNTFAIPIKDTEPLYENEKKINEFSNSLLDSTFSEDEIITLQEQLKSRNITKISINDLIIKELENIETLLYDVDLKYSKSPELSINNKLEFGSRHIRAVPRTTENDCKISQEALISMKAEISNVLQNSTQISNNNCELKNDALTCNELMKYIECGMANLKNQFIIATSRGSDSEEFLTWKTSFETLSATYLKMSDNLKRTTEEMYKKEIDNLKSTIQILLHIITILENNPCVVNVVIEV